MISLTIIAAAQQTLSTASLEHRHDQKRRAADQSWTSVVDGRSNSFTRRVDSRSKSDQKWRRRSRGLATRGARPVGPVGRIDFLPARHHRSRV
eukprot:1190006-Prorocentrum_minimum.AAC.1